MYYAKKSKVATKHVPKSPSKSPLKPLFETALKPILKISYITGNKHPTNPIPKTPTLPPWSVFSNSVTKVSITFTSKSLPKNSLKSLQEITQTPILKHTPKLISKSTKKSVATFAPSAAPEVSIELSLHKNASFRLEEQKSRRKGAFAMISTSLKGDLLQFLGSIVQIPHVEYSGQFYDATADILQNARIIFEGTIHNTTALQYLFQATLSNRSDVVDVLSRKGVDLDLQDSSGWTAAHLAAWKGHDTILTSLCARGADLEKRSHAGLTPVHVASVYRQVSSLRILRECYVSLDGKDSQGRTALLYAAAAGFEDVVSALVTLGADVDLSDLNATTPLIAASKSGHISVVRLLLRDGAQDSQDVRGRTALMYASGAGFLDVVKALLGSKVDILKEDLKRRTALYLASKFGRLEVVELLLREDGLQAKDTGESALEVALRKGHPEIAVLLVTAGAPFDAGEWRRAKERYAQESTLEENCANPTDGTYFKDSPVALDRIPQRCMREYVKILNYVKGAATTPHPYFQILLLPIFAIYRCLA